MHFIVDLKHQSLSRREKKVSICYFQSALHFSFFAQPVMVLKDVSVLFLLAFRQDSAEIVLLSAYLLCYNLAVQANITCVCK